MAGVDVISHLIKIEKRAAEFMQQAHTEADERIAKARAMVDVEFKEAYDQLVSEFEMEYDEQTQALQQQYTQEFNDFVNEVMESPQDTNAMRALVIDLLEKRLQG